LASEDLRGRPSSAFQRNLRSMSSVKPTKLPDTLLPGGEAFERTLAHILNGKEQDGGQGALDLTLFREECTSILSNFAAGTWEEVLRSSASDDDGHTAFVYPPSMDGISAAVLKALRCPSRLKGDDAAFCQETVWEIFRSLPGSACLFTSLPELRILSATSAAEDRFGMSLQGRELVSVIPYQEDSDFLLRSIRYHDGLVRRDEYRNSAACSIPGFACNCLGEIGFCDGNGVIVRFSVTVAHLPEEPRLGKSPAVLVVLCSPEDSNYKWDAGRKAGRHSPSRAQGRPTGTDSHGSSSRRRSGGRSAAGAYPSQNVGTRP